MDQTPKPAIRFCKEFYVLNEPAGLLCIEYEVQTDAGGKITTGPAGWFVLADITAEAFKVYQEAGRAPSIHRMNDVWPNVIGNAKGMRGFVAVTVDDQPTVGYVELIGRGNLIIIGRPTEDPADIKKLQDRLGIATMS